MVAVLGWIALGAVIAGGAIVGTTTLGQPLSVDEPYDIEQLERLIEVAREAGFSEEEIREITIEDDGEVINAWDFIQNRKERELARAKRERERREKVYLTVIDIMNDLDSEREGEIEELRDESIYGN